MANEKLIVRLKKYETMLNFKNKRSKSSLNMDLQAAYGGEN